jgi:transcriptional regulator with XRE-family HTH domain
LLASYLRNKMNEQELSLRRASEQIGCSPATLSRLMSGAASEYEADTATLTAATKWLNRTLADFELEKRPSETSLAEVEMHLHALPHVSEADVRAMMAVITTLYDEKRKRQPSKE